MNTQTSSNNQGDRDDLRARFTAWISVVVWRARRDYFRTQKHRFREIPIEEIEDIPDDTGFEILEKDEFLFADEHLARAFLALPVCQQQVLTLRIAKGLSPTEIAGIMGCDSARISRQLYNGLAALRREMEKEAFCHGEI